MAALVYIVLLLALTGHSSAIYCICKDGVGDSSLQKALDYACGAGADCAPILQSGACFQPNTVKDHCNWAVNSYFQRKGQTALSCDFSGAAVQSQTAPTTSSTCVYPASTSQAGTGTTNSTTPSTGNGTTPSTGTGTTPSTGTGTGITPTTGSTTGTTTPSSVFGMSPTGSGITDNTGGVASLKGTNCFFFCSLASILWLSVFLLLWG